MSRSPQERVRKLRALQRDKAASPAEAATAGRMADKIEAKHGAAEPARQAKAFEFTVTYDRGTGETTTTSSSWVDNFLRNVERAERADRIKNQANARRDALHEATARFPDWKVQLDGRLGVVWYECRKCAQRRGYSVGTNVSGIHLAHQCRPPGAVAGRPPQTAQEWTPIKGDWMRHTEDGPSECLWCGLVVTDEAAMAGAMASHDEYWAFRHACPGRRP